MLLCIILYRLINVCMYNNHCNIIATTFSLCLRIKVITMCFLLLLYARPMDINRRMKLYSIYKALHRLL